MSERDARSSGTRQEYMPLPNMADRMTESAAIRSDLMTLRETRNLVPAGITAALLRLPWYLQGDLSSHAMNFMVDTSREFFLTAVEHIKRDLTEQSKERGIGGGRPALYKTIRFMEVRLPGDEEDAAETIDNVRVIALDGMVVAVLFHVTHAQPELVSNVSGGNVLAGLWMGSGGVMTAATRDVVWQLQHPRRLGLNPGHALAVLTTCNAMRVFDPFIPGGAAIRPPAAPRVTVAAAATVHEPRAEKVKEETHAEEEVHPTFAEVVARSKTMSVATT